MSSTTTTYTGTDPFRERVARQANAPEIKLEDLEDLVYLLNERQRIASAIAYGSQQTIGRKRVQHFQQEEKIRNLLNLI